MRALRGRGGDRCPAAGLARGPGPEGGRARRPARQDRGDRRGHGDPDAPGDAGDDGPARRDGRRGRGRREAGGPVPGRPPEFLRDSGRELHEAVAELVFAPHRAELRIDPSDAAAGHAQPGHGVLAPRRRIDDERLTPDEVADLLLDGVRRTADALAAPRRAGSSPYRREIWTVVVLQLVGTIASLFLPSLNADIIDNGVAAGDTATIVRLGSVMLAVSLVQIACSVAAVYVGARTAMAFGRDVRRDLFGRVGSFSTREVNHFGAPSLITRTTNDVQQVQMLVLMSATMMVSAPIMMVGGVLMAVREDVGLSWLLVVSVPAPRRHRRLSSSAGWSPASGSCRSASTA